MTAAAGAAGSSGALSFHPHPDVWLLVAFLSFGYLWAVKRVGPRRVPAETPVVTRRQMSLYFLGVAAIWLAADWPVHELSEDFLFSVHMIQHLVFTFVGPPLLLMGMPRWMLRWLLAPQALFKTVRFFSRPVLALLIFNGLIAFTHWPALVDLSLRSEGVHFLIHSALFVSATLMWMPVIEPLPELARLSDPAKMMYLFLQSVVPTVPASFLTFATAPIYHGYDGAPRLLSWLSVLDDQRVAGLIMKLGGGLLLWGIITVMFFRWNAKEQSNEVESISWEDFERELDVWELRKP